MICNMVEELTPIVRTRPACLALGASPATIYRRRTGRIDRPLGIEQRRLRRRPRQRDRLKPGAVTLGSRLPVIEPQPMTQKQLREPMPGTHQIHPDRFAGADQVTQRLLFGSGHLTG